MMLGGCPTQQFMHRRGAQGQLLHKLINPYRIRQHPVGKVHHSQGTRGLRLRIAAAWLISGQFQLVVTGQDPCGAMRKGVKGVEPGSIRGPSPQPPRLEPRCQGP